MIWFLGFTPPPIGFFRFSMQTNNETLWWDGLMLKNITSPTYTHLHTCIRPFRVNLRKDLIYCWQNQNIFNATLP